MQGELGLEAVVQWAGRLGDTNQWYPLTNALLGTNPFQFVDFGVTQAPNRFYRVLMMPPTNRIPAHFVLLPPGTFIMGSPTTEQDRESDEGPQTTVTITRSFWISKYEVTQGEWIEVMGTNPSAFPGDTNRPVENVSWIQATNYCAILTQREQAAGRLQPGYRYRLPTEAEWEYACRAGMSTRFNYGDDPGYAQLGQFAWFGGNSGGTTHAVGQKLPNLWGLYDMHGNVWEWCWDWVASSLPGGNVTDPTGPPSGLSRILRGGGWSAPAMHCRSAVRGDGAPNAFNNSTGFRPVIAAD